MRRVSNILLDLDGTLTDSRPGIVGTIQHALRSLGVEPPPESELLWCVGPPLREIFGRLLPDCDLAMVDRAVTAYVDRYRAHGHLENRVYEGIPEMLSALGANSKLLLVTAKHQDSAERIVEVFSLRQHFSAVFGSNPSGHLADKRALVRHALETLGLNPLETAIVGDRIHDIEGGRHNRIVTVGAAWGYGTDDELADADYVCATPQEVAALLSK